MSNEDKALALLIKQQQQRYEIKMIGRRIGYALSECKLIKSSGVPHLKEWYAPAEIENSYGHIYNSYADAMIQSDPDECKEQCEHCWNAHQLIQERKELRKQLGITRRTASRLANQIIKQGAAS